MTGERCKALPGVQSVTMHPTAPSHGVQGNIERPGRVAARRTVLVPVLVLVVTFPHFTKSSLKQNSGAWLQVQAAGDGHSATHRDTPSPHGKRRRRTLRDRTGSRRSRSRSLGPWCTRTRGQEPWPGRRTYYRMARCRALRACTGHSGRCRFGRSDRCRTSRRSHRHRSPCPDTAGCRCTSRSGTSTSTRDSSRTPHPPYHRLARCSPVGSCRSCRNSRSDRSPGNRWVLP